MNHNSFRFMLVLTSLLLIASSYAQKPTISIVPPEGGQAIQQLPAQKKQRQQLERLQSLNQGNLTFYADFEECNGSLPEGWSTLSTPDYADDLWVAGNVMDNMDNSLVKGANGYGMAFLAGSQSHEQDAWAFSPKFTLEAGCEYRIVYYDRFYGGYGLEHMKSWLGTEQNPESMTMLMIEDDNESGTWKLRGFYFTPETTGEYCLGFEGLSDQKATGLLLDYILVTGGPVLNCESTITLPSKTAFDEPVEATFYVSNIGSGEDLSISLGDGTSPELSVEGLPMSLSTSGYGYIKVTADVRTVGEYFGCLVLNTNNPAQNTVYISVQQTITEAITSQAWFEDFTKGCPQGWVVENGYFSKDDGVDGSMSLWGTLDEMNIISHYTEMGSSPKLSFDYFAQAVDLMDNVKDVTKPENVKLNVQVFDSDNMQWEQVYTISEEENPYQDTKDFIHIEVDLSQYANKTCKLKFNVPSILVIDWSTFDMTTLNSTFDNIWFGTQSVTDVDLRILEGPRTFKMGEQASLRAHVRNNGSQTISPTVQLFTTDDMPLASVIVDDLASEETRIVELTWISDNIGSIQVYSVATVDNDDNPSNNRSSDLTVAIIPENAQNVFVGDDKFEDTYNQPFDFYNKKVAAQTIYLANEINTTYANIYGIKYYTSSKNDYLAQGVSVYVGETDKENFSDSQFVDVATLTKVYEGEMFFQGSGTNTIEIPFLSPYAYQGGNLVVYVYHDDDFFVMNKLFYSQTKNAGNRTISSVESDQFNMLNPQMEESSVYNRFASVDFIMLHEENGNLSGQITESSGEPLQGVSVSIEGTKLTTTTDAEGKYFFEAVAYGDLKLILTCHGYQTSEHLVTIDAPQVTADFLLDALPLFTLSGKVSDCLTGEAVKGALVRLVGYENYVVASDEQGKYEFKEVYSVAQPYQVFISAPYYKTYAAEDITLISDTALNVEIEENPFPVRSAAAKVGPDGSVEITWKSTMPVYRHDSGIPSDYRGFVSVDDYKTAVLGSVYRHRARIYDIQWYLHSDYGPHDEVYITIFPLDDAGEPTYNVSYQTSAANSDNQWNTFSLNTPFDAPNGFCIALSYNGYLSLCEASPTEEYPAAARTNYYCNNYAYGYTDSDGNRLVSWHDSYTTYQGNPLMLRAVGYDFGLLDNEFVSTPMIGNEEALNSSELNMQVVNPLYSVYRLEPEAEAEQWILIAEGLTELQYSDDDFASLAAGQYQYAVVANYGNKTSDPRFTEIIEATTLAIDDLTVELGTDEANYVYSITGILMSKNGPKGLPAGVYIMNHRKIMVK